MKICSVGAELFHAGGRMNGRIAMTKLMALFFANAPKHISALCGQNVELLNLVVVRMIIIRS
jgi:hypothetical protein